MVSGSGISWAICNSAPLSRQITMPAPHHSVFLHAGCPSCHPTNSVKALKACLKALKACLHTYTHTHPFNAPFSGTTRVSRYQKGKNQSGIYWSKRQWVAVASAGPYASLHLAADRQPRHDPTTQFFTGRMPFLPPNQQRQSTEGSLYLYI